MQDLVLPMNCTARSQLRLDPAVRVVPDLWSFEERKKLILLRLNKQSCSPRYRRPMVQRHALCPELPIVGEQMAEPTGRSVEQSLRPKNFLASAGLGAVPGLFPSLFYW